MWTRFLPLYIPHPQEAIPKNLFEESFDPGSYYGKGILRKASVRECLRLQGFPDDFEPSQRDSASYEQIGNAVNVKVAESLLGNLLKYIGEE